MEMLEKNSGYKTRVKGNIKDGRSRSKRPVYGTISDRHLMFSKGYGCQKLAKRSYKMNLIIRVPRAVRKSIVARCLQDTIQI